MNVSSVLTKDYENVPLRRRGENKPNQTQKTHPGTPGFSLRSQSFSKNGGNWLIWRIT